MSSYSEIDLLGIAENFDILGKCISAVPYGEGHINSTYLATFDEVTNNSRYILQLINTNVFKNPDELMFNISNVTKYLLDIIIKNGGDCERETMQVVNTKKGRLFYRTLEGDCFRCYKFVEDSICYQTIQKPEDFFNCGSAFGNFQKLLSDYPAKELYETIKNFHNTVDRYRQLDEAIKEDKVGRLSEVKAEIEFALGRREAAAELVNALDSGKIPYRVTHNDTKLNNILFDAQSNKCICVIDLDTIMPGAAAYDFGDSIRFGASTGAEDEKDLSKIEMSLELFETFAKGYMSVAKEFLTDDEVDSLSVGAKIMTLECGVRFLTDYLNGDTYFKIHRPEHNLDRCRTQFKLVADMETKMDEMKKIVRKYR